MNKTRKKIVLWGVFTAQFYMLLKFSNYTSYGYLLVFMMSFPLYLLDKAFVGFLSDSYEEKKSGFAQDTIILFVLSVIIYYSIYKRLTDHNTLGSIVLAVSRFVFVFVFTYTFAKYLLKISIKSDFSQLKRTSFIIYIIPSLVIMTIIWLAAYPANMSPDSNYIWNSVILNEYAAYSPLLYMLGVKLLSLIWEYPAVTIIAQILLCSFTFAYLVYSLDKWGLNKKLCLLIAVILPAMPVNSIFAVTLWKDIPYTMGIILISIEFVRPFKEPDYYNKKINIISFTIIVFFTVAMRHNAPYVVAFSMAVYVIILLVKKLKKRALTYAMIAIACIALFAASTNIAKAALGDNYSDEDSSSSYYALPLQGIMAVYNDAYNELTDEQLAKINKYLYMDEVLAHYEEFATNERWRNFTRTRRLLNMEELENDTSGFLTLYVELLIQNPVIVTRSYFDQTAIIWCSRDVSYISGMPWYIYPSDKYENIERDSKIVFLSNMIEKWLNLSQKGIRGFFEHPASMMMLILILAYVGFKKKGIKSLIFILPALFNSLGYMATIEGQCTRYTYVNYTIAIAYFVYVQLDEKEKSVLTEPNIKQ